MGGPARVLGGRNGLRIEGLGALHPGLHETDLVASLDVVGPASLAALRQGLRRWSPGEFRHASVSIVDVPAADLATKPNKYWPEPVQIRLIEYGDSEFSDEYYVFAYTFGDPDEGLPNVRSIEKLIRPLIQRSGAVALVGVDDDDESNYGGAYQLGVEITMPSWRTVADAYHLAKGALALIEAADGGALERETTLDLLRSGRVDVLLGQPENDWLDFKREGYARTDRGKLELAKDVAAFANAAGGILMLGVATTKAGHLETASAIMPCLPASISVNSYRAILARRVHPPPEHLEMFAIRQKSGGDVWVLSVPPQPEEFKPLLVHALMSAGRAALRAPVQSPGTQR
jgi:hypothetical protein